MYIYKAASICISVHLTHTVITSAGLVNSQQISKCSCGVCGHIDCKGILNETDLERRHRQLAAVPPFPMCAFCAAIALTMNWLNTQWDIFDKQCSAASSVPLFIRLSSCLIFQHRQQGYYTKPQSTSASVYFTAFRLICYGQGLCCKRLSPLLYYPRKSLMNTKSHGALDSRTVQFNKRRCPHGSYKCYACYNHRTDKP